MMKIIPKNPCILLFLCYLRCISAAAQKDSSSTIKIGGYIDTYFATYSDSVGAGKYQKFAAISPRNDNFGINVAQVSMQYNSPILRSTITLHSGDLPNAAWSPVYNFIQEANAGIALTKKLWLDAGFFKTHIGTEALLPKDNITSSISIITFYEPWWQAGGRLVYTPDEKWQMALYVVNGYNEFIATNKKKAAGLAITYALSDKGSIGYYNFISDNTPDNDPVSHTRILNNVVFNYELSKEFKIIAGVDFISQQHSQLSDTAKSAFVYSYILTLKYQFTHFFGIYARGEMFNDVQGIFTSDTLKETNGNVSGYMLNGATLGIEFKPAKNSYIRIEGRELKMAAGQNIFYTDGKYVNYRDEAMVTLGIWF
ncbi:MAG: outer membrane beta-barrel protein [Bacteroidia bacterium]